MRVQHLAAVIVSAALVLAAPASAGAEGSDPADSSGGAVAPADSSAAAKEALARVQEAFAEKPRGHLRSERVVNAPVANRDATFLLRDLRISLESLDAEDRAAAEQYLQRPSDTSSKRSLKALALNPSPLCTEHVCVHFVTSGDDAPPLTDLDKNGWPDQVDRTAATMEHVWDVQVTQGGYHPPLSDSDSEDPGPDGKLDVGLADLGSAGLFGFCDSDDPSPGRKRSAFCMLDNDFVEFGEPPLDSLRVTAAHEFFHAVQFSYDYFEDRWMMESTAAWMEDVVYDAINDNMAYLNPRFLASTLSHPRVPLDRFDGNYPNYGGWVFWKKLGETFPTTHGHGMPDVVRSVWTRTGNAGVYSTVALSRELATKHTSLATVFATWGVGNRFPGKSYDEGRANHYPRPPLSGRFGLSKSKRQVGWHGYKLDHLTNQYIRFAPNSSLTGKKWRLRVTIDADNKIRGSRASLVIYRKSGAIRRVVIPLNAHGNGVKGVAFGRGGVKYVELTLTNASTRFSCNKGTAYSCSGASKDQNVPFKFRASLNR